MADVARPSKERRLALALLLNLVIVGVQVAVGIIAASLGLLADAAHNITDVAAIVVSLTAVRMARRRATAARSFGFHRGTILAAQVNAASIVVVSVLVAVEASRRFGDTQPVDGGLVLVVALIAAAANFGAAAVLGHAGHDEHEDLNMRSALLHMVADGAVSVGVALAGLVILLTDGWYWLDPAVSLVISLVIGVQGWRLLRATAEVLLESTPSGLDVDSVAATMVAVGGVESVHDLHVWSLSSEVRAMSAHVVLAGHPTLEEAQVVGGHVKASIMTPFRLAHVTLELECEACGPPEDHCAIGPLEGSVGSSNTTVRHEGHHH